MFAGNYALSSLDISNFDTTSVQDFNGMFYGTNLTTLNLSHFNTTSATGMLNIALASLREVQQICKLEGLKALELKADSLGAMIYALNRKLTDTVYR